MGVLHGGSVAWGYLKLDKLPHSSGAPALRTFFGNQKSVDTFAGINGHFCGVELDNFATCVK